MLKKSRTNQLQTNEIDIKTATGIKCYLDKLMVNGQLKKEYPTILKQKN